MSWQISSLVLRTWRHWLGQLLRRTPILWLLFPLGLALLLCLGLLNYTLFARVTSLVLAGPQLQALAPLLLVGFFSFFGLMVFLILTLVLLISPEDTLLRRLLAPLPISSMQIGIGLLLPALFPLLLIQGVFWLPGLLALVQAGLITPLQLGLTFLLGLLCYNALTLAFHQVVLYGAARLFGVERQGLRISTLGLSCALGIVLLTVPEMLLGPALLAHQIGLLALAPSYWMTLILEPGLGSPLLGAGLLTLVTLLAGGLYAFMLDRYQRLTTGTRGQWVPLRRLPFGPSLFLSACVYELKSICRDQHLIVGWVLLIGLWLAALVGIWLTRATQPLVCLAIAVLALGVLLLGLVSVSQTSWGRDRVAYRLLTVTPLELRRLWAGKFWTCLALTELSWLLAALVLVLTAGLPALLLQWLLPALLLAPLCFLLGILFPYSSDDQLSTLVMGGVLLLLELPLFLGSALLQNELSALPGGLPTQLLLQLGLGLLLIGLLYRLSLWLAATMLERERV